MSVQCGSMNCSTTTLPRRLSRDSEWPSWSVRVNPGAAVLDSGDSDIRLASGVDTVAGRPDTRGSCAGACAWLCRVMRYAGTATIAPSSTVATPHSSASRTRLPPRGGGGPSADSARSGPAGPGPPGPGWLPVAGLPVTWPLVAWLPDGGELIWRPPA